MQYFADPWNTIDIGNITLGFFNIYCQLNLGTWELVPKITMVAVIILCLIKTFFFMRIFLGLSYIVTMLVQVV